MANLVRHTRTGEGSNENRLRDSSTQSQVQLARRDSKDEPAASTGTDSTAGGTCVMQLALRLTRPRTQPKINPKRVQCPVKPTDKLVPIGDYVFLEVQLQNNQVKPLVFAILKQRNNGWFLESSQGSEKGENNIRCILTEEDTWKIIHLMILNYSKDVRVVKQLQVERWSQSGRSIRCHVIWEPTSEADHV